jgi:predicted ATPase
MIGRVLADQGEAAAALSSISQGLQRLDRIGQEVYRSYMQAILAEAQSALGDTATAIVTMEDALRTAQAQEERWALAAHQCLLGDLYNRLTPAKEELAERMLLSAIVTARTQRARSLELRAATSLARLWAERGERHRAHSLLAPIFGWFTEGFDTPDLQEARMLLNELASDPCTGPQF